MTDESPAFAPDDYVVRYGMRGFVAALLGLAGWTVLAVIVVAARVTFPSVAAAMALATGELGLLAACGVELHRAARREVLFAVSSDGVYFGSGPAGEDVPWDRICAVELFTEPGPRRRPRGAYRCVGVRVRGTAASAGGTRTGLPNTGRPGACGSGAGGMRAGRMRAGRINPDGTSGDETARLAYRRMIGWRADRARLTEVASCYAPSVPVRESTGWPLTLSGAQARHPSS
jgi:hypothetical protein